MCSTTELSALGVSRGRGRGFRKAAGVWQAFRFAAGNFGEDSENDGFSEFRDVHIAVVFLRQGFTQLLGTLRLSVDQPDLGLGSAGAVEPVEQLGMVGVAGEGIDRLDPGTD